VLAVPLCAEGLLRLSYAVVNEPGLREQTDYINANVGNIYRQWHTGQNGDVLRPPFSVFANRGFREPGRLDEVLERTRLPAGRTLESYDFLRFNFRPEETRYTAHINSLGFRGPERSVAKPRGVIRIIALGSYQTFGLGVNDSDSYPSQLEELLNRGAKRGRRFEVWNGGRPAGSAIHGLARLERELDAYSPDLLIFDYGFVDPQLFGDDFFMAAVLIPGGAMRTVVSAVLMPLLAAFPNSLLLGRIDMAVSHFRSETNLAAFRDVLGRVSEVAKKRKIPVIYMTQIGAYWPERNPPQGEHLDVIQTFLRRPPAAELYLRGKDSWLRDLSASAVRYPAFFFFPYRLNFYQLNRQGLRTVAETLAEIVGRVLK